MTYKGESIETLQVHHTIAKRYTCSVLTVIRVTVVILFSFLLVDYFRLKYCVVFFSYSNCHEDPQIGAAGVLVYGVCRNSIGSYASRRQSRAAGTTHEGVARKTSSVTGEGTSPEEPPKATKNATWIHLPGKFGSECSRNNHEASTPNIFSDENNTREEFSDALNSKETWRLKQE